MLVLLVSSKPEIRLAVQEALRAHRHPLVCAPSLEKARAIVRQASPDLIISDLGSELSSLLPQLAPTTAVLKLTEDDQPSQDRRAPVVLMKPFQSDELMTAIRRARGLD
jgi:DNA-binding response OmpR family regulator